MGAVDSSKFQNVSVLLHREDEAIDLLPDDDWICITDQDTLKFNGFALHVKEIILSVSKDVIFTSRVNRLAKSNPAVIDALYDCEDIDEHKDMASFLWEQNIWRIRYYLMIFTHFCVVQ